VGAVSHGNEALMSVVMVRYIRVGCKCRTWAEERTISAHNNPILKQMTLKNVFNRLKHMGMHQWNDLVHLTSLPSYFIHLQGLTHQEQSFVLLLTARIFSWRKLLSVPRICILVWFINMISQPVIDKRINW
jgi:hypothetical protein